MIWLQLHRGPSDFTSKNVRIFSKTEDDVDAVMIDDQTALRTSLSFCIKMDNVEEHAHGLHGTQMQQTVVMNIS